MALPLITYLYEYLAMQIMGSPLLFGVLVVVFAVGMLVIAQLPKWAIFSYSTPVILALCAPAYEPLLLPEWVFYIVLIFLGIMWGIVIISFKQG